MTTETNSSELIYHVKLQVANIIMGYKPFNEYTAKAFERELHFAAKTVLEKPVSRLTINIAEEMASENRRRIVE